MLTVLGGLAEFERSEAKLTKHQQAEARARIAQGETLTAIARAIRLAHDD
jgi:hypothetical protein